MFVVFVYLVVYDCVVDGSYLRGFVVSVFYEVRLDDLNAVGFPDDYDEGRIEVDPVAALLGFKNLWDALVGTDEGPSEVLTVAQLVRIVDDGSGSVSEVIASL